jgi:purine nucleosidase
MRDPLSLAGCPSSICVLTRLCRSVQSSIENLCRAANVSAILLVLLLATPLFARDRRKVIIDQDCSGPAGSNMQAVATLVQSPDVEPLGVAVVTGDAWRDEEIVHALRLLEVIGRPDIPVLPGAAFPLVNTREDTEIWERLYGKISYKGAWDPRWWHEPFVVPPPREGPPSTKASGEDAAHFMVRMVHEFPHQVTIYAAGPMTDVALAIRLDPEFPALAQELVFMGGSLNPESTDPEWASNPRHEFNLQFDPEAAHIVLSANWAKVTCTPVDISIKTHFTHDMAERIARSGTPLAQYLLKYYYSGIDYMWDELAAAAWLDPGIITRQHAVYMDVDISHGPSYGNTLTWLDYDKPAAPRPVVQVQDDLDAQRFYQLFLKLMSAPAPGP